MNKEKVSLVRCIYYANEKEALVFLRDLLQKKLDNIVTFTSGNIKTNTGDYRCFGVITVKIRKKEEEELG